MCDSIWLYQCTRYGIIVYGTTQLYILDMVGMNYANANLQITPSHRCERGEA